MKIRILIIIIVLFVIQSVLLFFLFGVGEPEGPQRTAIPTLARATMPAPQPQSQLVSFRQGECDITALDLIGAWVAAGKPESEPFEFSRIDGETCNGSFETDVMPLFNQPNIWHAGAIACTTCHGADITRAAGRMSLADHGGILAGSRRESQDVRGEDILGTADTWEKSRLHIQLFTRQMPIGRPQSSPAEGPVIRVGQTVE
jgi:hypothetical protein